MTDITCKFVVPTANGKYLRVYWGKSASCNENGGFGYHNAMVLQRMIPRSKALDADGDYSHEASELEYEAAKGEWPTKCDHCGTTCPERTGIGHHTDSGAIYMIFYETMYDNPPRAKQPGDIFACPWMGSEADQWAVVLPGGVMWHTYQPATNCNHPEEKGRLHKCWTITGTVPNLTAFPSIQVPGWHGFLRNGILTTA